MKSPLPRVYLDYDASTPIDLAVVAAMRPYLQEHFGNPSSGHWAAAGAKAALEDARGRVAGLLGAKRDEIMFTSGGSEANNLALKGVAWAFKAKGDHIITSTVEHPATVGPEFPEAGGLISYGIIWLATLTKSSRAQTARRAVAQASLR